MKKDALLIDIDGTICDSSYAISFLNGTRDKNNYDVYYRTLDICKPLNSVIDEIHKIIEDYLIAKKELTLVFLTGRNPEQHVLVSTSDFINTHFISKVSSKGIKYDFYFRPINLFEDALTYKTNKFQILKNLYNFTHIFEDEPSNVLMFYNEKQEGCVVHWVKSLCNYALSTQIDTTLLDSLESLVVHQIK